MEGEKLGGACAKVAKDSADERGCLVHSDAIVSVGMVSLVILNQVQTLSAVNPLVTITCTSGVSRLIKLIMSSIKMVISLLTLQHILENLLAFVLICNLSLIIGTNSLLLCTMTHEGGKEKLVQDLEGFAIIILSIFTNCPGKNVRRTCLYRHVHPTGVV